MNFKKKMMISKKKEINGKKTSYILGMIGFGIPEVDHFVTEEQFNSVEEGMEVSVSFKLEEQVLKGSYGFDWSFKPVVDKIGK